MERHDLAMLTNEPSGPRRILNVIAMSAWRSIANGREYLDASLLDQLCRFNFDGHVVVDADKFSNLAIRLYACHYSAYVRRKKVLCLGPIVVAPSIDVFKCNPDCYRLAHFCASQFSVRTLYRR